MLDSTFPLITDAFTTVVPSALAMYVTVLLFARIAGVRSFAQMSNFDIAITIAIGSTVATTVVGEQTRVVQGVFALGSLYAIQLAVSKLRHRSRKVEETVDNRPILLMSSGGRMLERNMRVARITADDLRSVLRRANVQDLACVRAVVMEGTGEVHVLHGHDVDQQPDPWIVQGVRNYEADDPLLASAR